MGHPLLCYVAIAIAITMALVVIFYCSVVYESSCFQAKEVLRWKKEQTVAASALWTSLASINRQIFDSLQHLSHFSKVGTVIIVLCCIISL